MHSNWNVRSTSHLVLGTTDCECVPRRDEAGIRKREERLVGSARGVGKSINVAVHQNRGWGRKTERRNYLTVDRSERRFSNFSNNFH